jgi:hypothetical protein
LIGGTRIIGGDKKLYLKGYCEGLKLCLETDGNLQRLFNIRDRVWTKLLKEGFKKEDTEMAAKVSRIPSG